MKAIKSGSIGGQVSIKRATPVNVDLYGTKVVLRTHASTIGELIKEKNIVITKDDKLSSAPNTPITANAQFAVLRTGGSRTLNSLGRETSWPL